MLRGGIIANDCMQVKNKWLHVALKQKGALLTHLHHVPGFPSGAIFFRGRGGEGLNRLRSGTITYTKGHSGSHSKFHCPRNLLSNQLTSRSLVGNVATPSFEKERIVTIRVVSMTPPCSTQIRSTHNMTLALEDLPGFLRLVELDEDVVGIESGKYEDRYEAGRQRVEQ